MRSVTRLLTLGLLLLGSACVEEEELGVDAQQLEGAWVFTYSEAPTAYNQALTSGEVSVVDGCMLVGEAVIIWHSDHLDIVEESLQRVEDGEVITLQMGGGGRSLSEGSTLDDFPAEILEHCTPAEVWFTSPELPTLTAE